MWTDLWDCSAILEGLCMRVISLVRNCNERPRHPKRLRESWENTFTSSSHSLCYLLTEMLFLVITTRAFIQILRYEESSFSPLSFASPSTHTGNLSWLGRTSKVSLQLRGKIRKNWTRVNVNSLLQPEAILFPKPILVEPCLGTFYALHRVLESKWSENDTLSEKSVLFHS